MIDNLVIISYLIVLIIISIYYRVQGKDDKKFFTINSKFAKNKFVILATIFASSIGGGTTFGLSEKSFLKDLSFGFALILTIPIDIFIAKYIIPKLLKLKNINTIGDILYNIYGKPGKLISGFGAFFSSIGYMTVQICVSGIIIHHVTGINYKYASFFCLIFISLYTLIGGLQSLFATHILQFISVLFAVPIISIFGTIKLDTNKILNFISDNYTNYFNENFKTNILCAFLGLSVMGFHPNLIQRIIASKNNLVLNRAIYLKSLIYFIFIILITYNGILSNIYSSISKPIISVPVMIDYLLPIGLKGLVFAGLLASLISSADSDLNIANISMNSDILPILIKNNYISKNLIISLSRILCLIASYFSISYAINYNGLIELVIFAASFWAPLVVPHILHVIFNSRIKLHEFLISSIAGFSFSIFWEMHYYENYKIKGIFPGIILNIILTLSFYYLNKKISKKYK